MLWRVSELLCRGCGRLQTPLPRPRPFDLRAAAFTAPLAQRPLMPMTVNSLGPRRRTGRRMNRGVGGPSSRTPCRWPCCTGCGTGGGECCGYCHCQHSPAALCYCSPLHPGHWHAVSRREAPSGLRGDRVKHRDSTRVCCRNFRWEGAPGAMHVAVGRPVRRHLPTLCVNIPPFRGTHRRRTI